MTKLNKKLRYYQGIDAFAKELAFNFLDHKPITEGVLRYIVKMYHSAKVEQSFHDDFFESAYHSPITGELEFFISRILYHLSSSLNKNWKIYLRKQKGKTAPDIRIDRNNKTVAIIEIKAKAGWIQYLFSPERFQKDLEEYSKNSSKNNPEVLVENAKNHLKKYYEVHNITKSQVFLLLPTLALVHRKRYKTELQGYYEYFAKTSGLPKENLVLLSKNLRLDLSNSKENLSPTKDFETMLNRLIAF